MGEPTAHGKVLIALAECWPEWATAAEIARETGLSVQKVGALLARMATEDRVQRHPIFRRPTHWLSDWHTVSTLEDVGVLPKEAGRG